MQPANLIPADPIRVHRFAIISGMGWLIDFSIYNAIALTTRQVFLANLIGASTALCFVFVAAGATIFRQRRTSLPQAIIGYVLWNVAAVLAASLAIDFLSTLLLRVLATDAVGGWWEMLPIRVSHLTVAVPLAKIAFTPVTMYLNYVAMGLILERRLILK